VLELSSRVRRVESELFPAAVYMSLYATAGRDMVEGLYALAKERRVAPSFAKFVENVERLRVQRLMGTPHEALAEAARRFEGSRLSAVLLSAATARSVGISQEIQARDLLKSVLFELKSAYERLVDSLKTLSEVVLVFYGVLPLMMLVMASMFYSEGSRLMLLSYVFLLIPLMGVGLVFLIHYMYPKTPESFLREYRRYFLALPIGAAVGIASYFLLSGALPRPRIEAAGLFNPAVVADGVAKAYAVAVALGLAAAAAFAYVAVYYIAEARRRWGIISALPYFTRDMAEMVKLGYSPAQALPRIVQRRSYGRYFDKLLTAVGRRLVGGTFADAVKQEAAKAPWIASVILSAVGEAERLGSKAEVFADVADAARDVVDIMRAARSGIRGAVFFGIITVVIISVLLGVVAKQLLFQVASQATGLKSVGQAPISIQLVTFDKVPDVLALSLVGAVLNAVVLGIIIGKISDDNFLASSLYGLAAAAIATAAVLASVFF